MAPHEPRPKHPANDQRPLRTNNRPETIYLRRMLAWIPIAVFGVIAIEVMVKVNTFVGVALLAVAIGAGTTLRSRRKLRAIPKDRLTWLD
jgi:hypothetical protein